MSVPDGWLTTAAAGKRLGVSPGVITNWIRVGRQRGDRQEDRWRVDPTSVDDELERRARASWWRKVDLPERKAHDLQAAATRRLMTAASAWRRDPSNAQLTEALITAVDDREALIMRSKKASEGT